jgi:hypothetical protein
MNSYMTTHDVVSIEAQKHIFEGADGLPHYSTTFVIKSDQGKIELRAFSRENIVIDFKQTEVIE